MLQQAVAPPSALCGKPNTTPVLNTDAETADEPGIAAVHAGGRGSAVEQLEPIQEGAPLVALAGSGSADAAGAAASASAASEAACSANYYISPSSEACGSLERLSSCGGCSAGSGAGAAPSPAPTPEAPVPAPAAAPAPLAQPTQAPVPMVEPAPTPAMRPAGVPAVEDPSPQLPVSTPGPATAAGQATEELRAHKAAAQPLGEAVIAWICSDTFFG